MAGITARQEEELILEPRAGQRRYWQDLWAYRELLYVLAWRDIAIRYRQTAIGIAWAVVQPLAQMAVMVFVFGKMAKLPSENGAPYALMVFAAMLPWQFFASAISAASMSIAGNASLVSKVYFPRMIIPASAILTSMVDFLVSFLILVVIMLWYGYHPGLRILTLPAFVLLATIAALGPALLITALNTQYRDFRYIIPFIVQFGLYVSPVGFSSSVVRETLGEPMFLLYSLNPMVGVIEGFRWAILGGELQVRMPVVATAAALSLGFLVLGTWYFRRLERTFADVL